MRVSVILEQRFSRTPDGVVWTDSPYTREFWDRYFVAFDEVQVVARVQTVSSVPNDWKRADGDGVIFAPVPYYVGAREYLSKAGAVRRAVRAAIGDEDAVILRVPSQLASCLCPALRKRNHPYAAEVVGDPYDVFAPGVVEHPLRPLFRWWFTRKLRRHCQRAFAVSYVTAKTLQQRYPPAPNVFTTNYSSVQLSGLPVTHPRRVSERTRWRLVTVGSLAQLYKGTDVLIGAIARCRAEGLDLRLTILGDGRYRSQLEAQAAGLKLQGHVLFKGQLPAGEAVQAELDNADLFVLASRTEGLPRAMIEAMARAVPCIGSEVGGIRELLPPDDMFPPDDVPALAAKIAEVVSARERMEQMSQRNLAVAGDYREEILCERRKAFYEHVRRATAKWLGSETETPPPVTLGSAETAAWTETAGASLQ